MSFVPRVLLIVVDQLAGHWVEGVEVAEGIPPVNVWSYAKLNFTPNFRRLIEEGVFCFTWNAGVCDTPHGMKYLATGRYNAGPYWTTIGNWPYYPRTPENPGPMGLFEYAQHYAPTRIKPACFTTDHWIAPGYFYTSGYPVALSAYFPDEEMWHRFAKPYLTKRGEWNLVYIYFPVMDSVSYCPSYTSSPSNPRESKHAYMLFLDSLLGDVVSFLKEHHFWDETYLILASDHGYHAGCSTAREKGAKSPNWCSDHPPPYDCEVWDFENDRGAGRYSGCARRTFILVSGGALDNVHRGRVLREAEIIDVAPTIAEILDVPYECEGKSVLSRKSEMLELDWSLPTPRKPPRQLPGS